MSYGGEAAFVLTSPAERPIHQLQFSILHLQSQSSKSRGHSSVGRAPALQAGCQGFESPCLQIPQVDRPLRRAMLTLRRRRICCHRAAERSIHLGKRIDDPWPVFSLSAQTSDNGIPANVSHLNQELFAPLVIAQSMIEVTFLPLYCVIVGLEMFPIADHSTHRLISRKRQKGVNVIRHQ